MANHRGSVAVQHLLMCCALTLLFARRVAPASRGFMSPAPAPSFPAAPAATPAIPTTAPDPTPEPTSPAAPALTPANPTTAPAPAPGPSPLHFIWNVEYILWASDCRQRGMIGINGTFPGPNITAKAGDRIVVVVNNLLHTEGVVIHWHGIRQIGTPWADGTASISQCAINPGESFTYSFTVDKPGTFFYHGHFGMQRAAGLYGSLIVNGTDQQKEPFADEYDGELNMLLSDWYHEAVYAQAAGLERKGKHFQWIGEPQTILINGRGQYDCTLGDVGEFQRGIRRDVEKCDAKTKMDQMKDVVEKCDRNCSKDGMTAAAKAVCEDEKKVSCETIMKSECGPFCRDTQCGPVVFDVEPAKTYRLRIASTTSLSALNVQIQRHKLKVVEADGNYVDPFVVDDIDIYSGESYSVLLQTDAALTGSYWISVGVRGRRPKTLPALAILRYSNSDSAWPTETPPETPRWDDLDRSKAFTYRINASTSQKVPEPTGGSPIVMLNTQDVVEGQVKWAINHVSLRLPATPYLGAYYAGVERDVFDTAEAPRTFNRNYDIRKPPEDQDPAAKTPTTVRDQVYRFRDGEVVDVVIQNANAREKGVSESHPWHLHGHDFWVLGYGEGRYDPATDWTVRNTTHPPLRNTVVVFPFGWTAIRFVADNPGVWAFHCHIEPHLHMGMGVVFAEGIERLHELKEHAPKEAFMCGVVSTRATVPLPLAPAASPSPSPSP